MGGTRLIRGYAEVEKQRQSTKATTKQSIPSSSPKPANGVDDKMAASLLSATASMDSDLSQQRSTTPTPHEVTEEEPSEQDEDDEIRKIDHLVFAVHG